MFDATQDTFSGVFCMRKKSFIIILVMATLMLVACGDKAELYMGAAAGTDAGADTEVKETAIGKVVSIKDQIYHLYY